MHRGREQFTTGLKSGFLALMIAAGLLLGALASDAVAVVRWINLSTDNVYVARYRYNSGSSSSGGEGYRLPVVTPASWTFEGWWKIEPGDTRTMNAGHYYLEKNGNRISWKNLDNSSGFVKSGKFEGSVVKGEWSEGARALKRKGFKEVQFQDFTDGNYTISGDGYSLWEKTFSFDYSSRAKKHQSASFKVPGEVAYYYVKDSSRWASPLWDNGDRHVLLKVNIQGYQRKPFGAREPGYYRGTLTVKYVVPTGNTKKQTDRSKTFSFPKVKGYSVDRCREWGENCGLPAATAFCKSQGYSRAIDFDWEYYAPTRTIGGGEICDADYCTRLKNVVCQ